VWKERTRNNLFLVIPFLDISWARLMLTLVIFSKIFLLKLLLGFGVGLIILALL
jgi:hypothetical protein